MKYVRWSDNTCRAGHTNIHGLFTHNDVCALNFLTGYSLFTPTFYKPEWHSRNPSFYKVCEHLRTHPQAQFYFEFAESDTDKIITMLRTMGFSMIRGQYKR